MVSDLGSVLLIMAGLYQLVAGVLVGLSVFGGLMILVGSEPRSWRDAVNVATYFLADLFLPVLPVAILVITLFFATYLWVVFS